MTLKRPHSFFGDSDRERVFQEVRVTELEEVFRKLAPASK